MFDGFVSIVNFSYRKVFQYLRYKKVCLDENPKNWSFDIGIQNLTKADWNMALQIPTGGTSTYAKVDLNTHILHWYIPENKQIKALTNIKTTKHDFKSPWKT